jgi:hypothetical protein
MNLRLSLAEIWVPGRVRAAKVRELAARTAAGFGVAPPPLAGRRTRGILEGYARFTRECCDRAVAAGADLAVIRARLRREAFLFGLTQAVTFKTRSRREAARLLRLAYKAVGIDLRIGEDGDVRVVRCFFKDHYGPEACQLIASLDEGLMAGILGEGRLVFSDRMTSGQGECRARFEFREEGP